MKKNKITRTTKILTVFILIMMMSLQVFNQEEGLTFIKSVFNSKYQFGTTITSLDTPTNLKWKEDSTATATWDKVENANYYSVNVYIFDIENNLLATLIESSIEKVDNKIIATPLDTKIEAFEIYA